MTQIISIRVSESMAKDIEEIEKEEKTDRATVVRKLLAKAISERKLEKALALYCGGKITLWKASKNRRFISIGNDGSGKGEKGSCKVF